MAFASLLSKNSIFFNNWYTCAKFISMLTLESKTFNMENVMLAEKLIRNGKLTKEEYVELLNTITAKEKELLCKEAVRLREQYYGNKIYIRGLIEFTNYCKNNCLYCGIRGANKKANRYRLTREEILSCCEKGYSHGFRTFVLQGGEDLYYNDDRMEEIVSAIRTKYPDCAITLSIGERSFESYQRLKEAGADRYLLRHETANQAHYESLHPTDMSFERRREYLYQLKELGYQVGAGFMVGSPGQTKETLADDFVFLQELEPAMVGIGPFIPHQDTPFKEEMAGKVEDTLLYLSMIRIILPKVLLPATTALGTLDSEGREKGIMAGANVIMPNLSPAAQRKKYELYNNKLCTGEEAVEGLLELKKRISAIGCEIVTDRGDAIV